MKTSFAATAKPDSISSIANHSRLSGKQIGRASISISLRVESCWEQAMDL